MTRPFDPAGRTPPRLLKPPGSIPSIETSRPVAQTPPLAYPPLGPIASGDPGKGPGFALADHRHPPQVVSSGGGGLPAGYIELAGPVSFVGHGTSITLAPGNFDQFEFMKFASVINITSGTYNAGGNGEWAPTGAGEYIIDVSLSLSVTAGAVVPDARLISTLDLGPSSFFGFTEEAAQPIFQTSNGTPCQINTCFFVTHFNPAGSPFTFGLGILNPTGYPNTITVTASGFLRGRYLGPDA